MEVYGSTQLFVEGFPQISDTCVVLRGVNGVLKTLIADSPFVQFWIVFITPARLQPTPGHSS